MPDFTIERLGNCAVRSPLDLAEEQGEGKPVFVPENRVICYNIERDIGERAQSKRSQSNKAFLSFL